ncbi:hypothetical protein E5288_WYG004409 [Bos mutus]|uniref:Uncharacterized protein n=1 Tax=Bos mutus TaxID=72004 RepID=A0A6B0RRM0_9CETA|nr:hypothetical protein [Bos mutus]
MGTLSRAHCPPTQYCSSLFVDKVSTTEISEHQLQCDDMTSVVKDKNSWVSQQNAQLLRLRKVILLGAQQGAEAPWEGNRQKRPKGLEGEEEKAPGEDPNQSQAPLTCVHKHSPDCRRDEETLSQHLPCPESCKTQPPSLQNQVPQLLLPVPGRSLHPEKWLREFGTGVLGRGTANKKRKLSL